MAHLFARCCHFRVLHRKLRVASPPGFPFVQPSGAPILSLPPEGSLPLETCFAGGRGKVPEQRMLSRIGVTLPPFLHILLYSFTFCAEALLLVVELIFPALTHNEQGCYQYGLNFCPQEIIQATLFLFYLRDGAQPQHVPEPTGGQAGELRLPAALKAWRSQFGNAG